MKPCNQCGKCCVKYSNGGLTVTEDEIKSWELFRPDIAEYVRKGQIWHQPSSGKPIELCPWLRKTPGQNIYTCDIYFDRPDDCKYYPVTVRQMIDDECEMLEPADGDDPERAQKSLDKLMEDSRPAFDK